MNAYTKLERLNFWLLLIKINRNQVEHPKKIKEQLNHKKLQVTEMSKLLKLKEEESQLKKHFMSFIRRNFRRSNFQENKIKNKSNGKQKMKLIRIKKVR